MRRVGREGEVGMKSDRGGSNGRRDNKVLIQKCSHAMSHQKIISKLYPNLNYIDIHFLRRK